MEGLKGLVLIEFKYNGEDYWIIFNKKQYDSNSPNKPIAHLLNMTEKKYEKIMVDRYDVIVNDKGRILFKTEKDAQEAFDWIESNVLIHTL